MSKLITYLSNLQCAIATKSIPVHASNSLKHNTGWYRQKEFSL